MKKAPCDAVEDERETLRRELDHRVKNNLQLVESLISLSASETGSEGERIERLRSRVHVLGLAYELSIGIGSGAAIDAQRFLEAISRWNEDDVSRKSLPATVDCDDGLSLPFELAAPIGFIVNEALFAARHSPGHPPKKTIDTNLKNVPAGLELSINDTLSKNQWEPRIYAFIEAAASQMGAALICEKQGGGLSLRCIIPRARLTPRRKSPSKIEKCDDETQLDDRENR